jgi:hypothetical protein
VAIFLPKKFLRCSSGCYCLVFLFVGRDVPTGPSISQLLIFPPTIEKMLLGSFTGCGCSLSSDGVLIQDYFMLLGSFLGCSLQSDGVLIQDYLYVSLFHALTGAKCVVAWADLAAEASCVFVAEFDPCFVVDAAVAALVC